MEARTPRFAAQILLFDTGSLVLRAIENCAPFVDSIYVSYSPHPWAYNQLARGRYRNSCSPDIIDQSPHRNRITLLTGDWKTEEEQRNECLDRATADGFDYLIVQDADEFYTPLDYAANLQAIRERPDFPYYRTPWQIFWKSTQHVVVHRLVVTERSNRSVVQERQVSHNYSMAFALNLRTGVRFQRWRMPTQLNQCLILPGVCQHLSWVLSDAEVLRKIATWGHTAQVADPMLWYRVKWLGWTPASRNISPISPASYVKVIPFDGNLAPEIVDFRPGFQAYKEPSFADIARYSTIVLANQVRVLSGEVRSKARKVADGAIASTIRRPK